MLTCITTYEDVMPVKGTMLGFFFHFVINDFPSHALLRDHVLLGLCENKIHVLFSTLSVFACSLAQEKGQMLCSSVLFIRSGAQGEKITECGLSFRRKMTMKHEESWSEKSLCKRKREIRHTHTHTSSESH